MARIPQFVHPCSAKATLLGAVALLASCATTGEITSKPLQQPNVIVILADDLGYGDVSCYGATSLETPNIDRLAHEGMRFTNGYCSASTCSPTRFSLLTGMYAFRQEGTGIAPPNSPAIIKPGTETMPAMLQDAGYHTAVIGKWHLGLGEEPAPDWNGELNPGPLEIGFDHCLLLPTTNDRVPSVYVQDHHVLNLDPNDPLWVGDEDPGGIPTGKTHRDTLKMDWSFGHNQSIHNGIGRIGFFTGGESALWRDEDLADMWVDKSIEWIESHQEEPFFLFFSSHDIHVPRMPHERFQGSTELGYRGDAIMELDWSVGQLLDTLDRLDLADNTLVVFCSDNGPVLNDGYKDGSVEKIGDHKPSGPFRGGKYSVFEGGTRTPFITRWPGTIPAGVSDEMVCTIDLPASLAQMVNQPVPAGAFPDSKDVLSALLGKPGAEGRHQLVQQDNGAKRALRVEDWKLIRDKNGNFSLYNLADDPAETTDLIERYPDRAEELKQRLDKIEAGSTAG